MGLLPGLWSTLTQGSLLKVPPPPPPEEMHALMHCSSIILYSFCSAPFVPSCPLDVLNGLNVHDALNALPALNAYDALNVFDAVDGLNAYT
ncbi:hypothetical protein JB92DRAFT_3114339 [Gautieria morchelliformis]|nr:hypothetical protein JB92DRAFT_3114339 [Gautieria morchelliformis]